MYTEISDSRLPCFVGCKLIDLNLHSRLNCFESNLQPNEEKISLICNREVSRDTIVSGIVASVVEGKDNDPVVSRG